MLWYWHVSNILSEWAHTVRNQNANDFLHIYVCILLSIIVFSLSFAFFQFFFIESSFLSVSSTPCCWMFILFTNELEDSRKGPMKECVKLWHGLCVLVCQGVTWPRVRSTQMLVNSKWIPSQHFLTEKWMERQWLGMNQSYEEDRIE